MIRGGYAFIPDLPELVGLFNECFPCDPGKLRVYTGLPRSNELFDKLFPFDFMIYWYIIHLTLLPPCQLKFWLLDITPDLY